MVQTACLTLTFSFLFLKKDNGESRRQQPATSGGDGLPVLEAMRGLRGQNRRPLPPLHHGQLLAQPLPQVFLLPGPAGRNRHVVLHEKRHDPLQKRLHQVRKPGHFVLDFVLLLSVNKLTY